MRPPLRLGWRALFRFPRLTARIDHERVASTEVLLLEGDCLAPYLDTGDVILWQRSVEPRDGDLVVAKIWYEREDPPRGWMQRRAIKQLRIVDGRRYLCANEGALPADEIEILGTVVGWSRKGWWRRPSPRKLRLKPEIAAA